MKKISLLFVLFSLFFVASSGNLFAAQEKCNGYELLMCTDYAWVHCDGASDTSAMCPSCRSGWNIVCVAVPGL